MAKPESPKSDSKEPQTRDAQIPTTDHPATVETGMELAEKQVETGAEQAETGMEQVSTTDCLEAATVENGKTFEYPIEFRIRHKDAPIQVYMIGLFSEEDPAMISGFPASLEELRAVRPPDVCMGIFPRPPTCNLLLKHF